MPAKATVYGSLSDCLFTGLWHFYSPPNTITKYCFNSGALAFPVESDTKGCWLWSLEAAQLWKWAFVEAVWGHFNMDDCKWCTGRLIHIKYVQLEWHIPPPRPNNTLLYSLIDTRHLNMPVFFSHVDLSILLFYSSSI